jgi:hypothetical protein
MTDQLAATLLFLLAATLLAAATRCLAWAGREWKGRRG